MADVEIGFRAVFGYIDLTVLERVHRAGIDVDVGVELLLEDLDATGAQQTTEGGGGQAFAEGRDDATGDENMLGDVLLRIAMCSSNHGTPTYHSQLTRRVMRFPFQWRAA